MHQERIRALLAQSAFFQGLTQDDLDQLAQVVKPIEDPRRARRIPFARSEAFILLGGMQISWDFVANQPGIITCRCDVAGEECLLRAPPDLPNEIEGSGRSTTLGEVLRAFHPNPEGPTNNLQGDGKSRSELEFTVDDTNSRDDLEYLLCERLNLAFCDGDSTASGDGGSTGGAQNELESWYQLDSSDVLRLAMRSASFRNLLTTKLQPRARARAKRSGPVHCLTESEFRFLSQAFDYFSLTDVAKAFNEGNNPDNLVFGTICDGRLRVTLEYEGDGVKSERKKSATLNAAPMPRRSASKPEISASTTTTIPSAASLNASFELSAGHVIGESEVFMEVATCKSRLEVLEEGVVLGIKASTWAMFLNSVASDRTQKRLMECVETRTDLVKLRDTFPCLRRCRDGPLRLLVDSLETECCVPGERIQVEGSSITYLVRHGTMMVFQEEPANLIGSVHDNADVGDHEGDGEAEITKRSSSSLSSMSSASLPVSMGRIKSHSVRYIRTGEGFNHDVTTVLKRASTEQLMGIAAERSSSLTFYTAAGSGRTSHKGSDLSSSTGGNVNVGVGNGPVSACWVWKLPLSVLRRLFDLDPVFAADFEFMTMAPAANGTSASWSSVVTTGSKLTSASTGPITTTTSNSSTLSSGSASTTATAVLSPISFQAVMNHPIALSHFRRFLISIHAHENLDFYWTVQYFPKTVAQVVDDYRAQWTDLSTCLLPVDETPSFGLSAASSRERIVAILKEFVVNGAPNQINIKSEAHKRLMAALNDVSAHDKQIFDPAMEEVFGILCSDSFPRFIAAKDDAFKQMIRDVVAGVTENMFRSPTSQQLKSPPSPIKMYRSVSAGAALGAGIGQNSGNHTPRFSGRKSIFSNNSTAGGETSKPFTLDFGAL